jgi:hypothetical protein
VDNKLYRWSGTQWQHQDLSLTNEFQVLSVSNDTIFLSNGGFAKIPTVQFGGVQGELAFYDSPSTLGSMTIGSGLTVVGDTLSVVPQVLDSTRLVQDSILVYYQDSLEVGRDTITIPPSLIDSTRIISDTIAVYYQNGVEVDRDTISIPFDGYTIKGPPYAVDTSVIVSHAQATNYSMDMRVNSTWYDLTLDTLSNEGRLEYNATNGTLQFGMDRNVPMEVGQSLYNEPMVNQTGVLLIKGTVLMVDTSQYTQGNRLRVMPANASLPPDLLLGIAAEDIQINQEGFVVWFGNLTGTLSILRPVGETWAQGDLLYPHPTINGRLTNVLPQGGKIKIPIAVIKAINGNNVLIKVRMRIGEYLRNITDVDLTSPANGSNLFYENGLWKDTLYTYLDSIVFSVPNYMSVNPTTLSNSGTVTFGFQPQSSNTFFAGPTSGPNAAPAFRTLSQTDVNIAGGVTGAGSNSQVSFYNGTYTQAGDNNFTWDNTAKSLSLGGSGAASSLLTLNSTTRGLLIPRMTTAERTAIASPATGLMVYDLTLNALQTWNGTAWVGVGGSTAAGTNGQVQFNNNGAFGASSNLFWDAGNSRLGIGTSSPVSSVNVVSTGTTSSTSSFVIEKSDRTRAFVDVKDNGEVRFLQDGNINGAPLVIKGSSPYISLNYTAGHGGVTSMDIVAPYPGARFRTSGIYAGASTENATAILALKNSSSPNASVGVVTEGLIVKEHTNTTPLGNYLSSAALHIQSTVRGFLLPQMTSAQKNAITTPATGLQVFDTNLNQIQMYNGSVWINPASYITGIGSTSATNSLLVEASDGTDLFEVENGGLISVGKNVGGSGTQSTATIRVISGDTNTGLALVPKGSGAITAAVPDGTAAGGNARGTYAVDLQTFRNTNTQVASGIYSVITGGQYNLASSAYGVIGGGSFNVTSTNNYTSVLGGLDNQSTGAYASIGGGQANRATELASTVSGGQTNFASGSRSTVIGGDGNTASGNRAIAGGATNIASGEFSTAIGGWNSRAVLYGQRSIASGQFATSGTVCDNQTSDIRFRALVTGTSTDTLFLDGVSQVAQLSLVGTTNARVWNARIQCVAIVTAQGNGTVTAGLTHSETYDIVIKRTSAGTVIVGSNPIGVIRVSEMSTASFTVDADTTNNALRIRFTPPSGTGSTTTIRAAATAYLTELGY